MLKKTVVIAAYCASMSTQSCGSIAPSIPVDTADPDMDAVRRAAMETNDPEDAPEKEIVGSGYW
jgi:hypothetical protein